jgi:predicted nucleotidyltransferase
MEAAARYSLDRLASWNLNFDDIVKSFRPLTPSETVFLVGSVPEGLSDPLSDIDLIVIADNDLGHDVVVHTPECEESVARLPSGQEINFEYWNSEDLEDFVKRLNASMDTIDDPSKLNKLFRFGDRELMLLHRIRAGLALANPEVAEHWRKRLRLELLPDYFIIMHLGHHYGYREDAIAQVQYGDRLAALNVMRMSMDSLAAAMLASVGATNPYTKWRTRLLEQNKEALGAAEVDKLMGFLFPDINADAATVVREAAAFADDAIAEAITRRPQLVPVLIKLEDQISFVRGFGEIPDSAS